jgi:hypothetical protein
LTLFKLELRHVRDDTLYRAFNNVTDYNIEEGVLSILIGDGTRYHFSFKGDYFLTSESTSV